ncbi:MAG TPA: RsmE family RNA methyltransferase [bacterium]|nr:RsmE family RNA methyltransferase [bacterium]
MNIILLAPGECATDGTVTLRDRRAEHIRTVLRAEPGRSVRVGIVDGPAGEATVTALDGAAVTLRCRFAAAPPPPSGIILLLALPRPKVLKRLWSPLASFAVDRIILTNAARVEQNYFATHWLQPGEYRPRLQEGLEQAGHTRVPAVSIHRRLRPLLEDELAPLAATHALLAADLGGTDIVPLPDVAAPRPLVLAIGPEGGWQDHERALLARCGFRRVGLGLRPLRSDVACCAALGVITAHDRPQGSM